MEQDVIEKSIEKLHVERRSALTWKKMHKFTDWKSSPLSKIKGSSKIERMQSW